MLKNENKLKKRIAYIEEFGIEKASKHFGKKQSTLERNLRQASNKNMVVDFQEPKILLFDLEIAYMVASGIWRTGKQYVGHKQIEKPWSIISWAGKWLFEPEVFGEKVSGQEAINREDSSIVGSLYDKIMEADIIIAHNLKKFDRKKMNTRFIMNDYNPPSPYQMIDTLKQTRKEFDFISNSMAYLSQILAQAPKMDTDMSLWDDVCKRGDEDALDYMFKYNKRDVTVMEDVYLKIRPWIKSHPNLGLYFEDIGNRCTICGSRSLVPEGNFYFTPTGKYKAMRCERCHGIGGRDRHVGFTTEERQELYTSIAR